MCCYSSSREKEGKNVDFQYAAKIVCGVIKPDDTKSNSLPPGLYKTKVNVHNCSRCDCVTFRWKVAVGLPQLVPGPISDYADATLCPDEALEIDCSDIMKHLGFEKPRHIEGWVVIESNYELDVVAVYGTAQAADQPVNAFHTERIHPRYLEICDDFNLDISTGVSCWEVAGPPPATQFNEAVLGSVNPNWATLPGALWIHPPGDDYKLPEGDYTYRLKFKLCSGFRNPQLNLSVLADYYANVFLNGHQVPPASNTMGWSTPVVRQCNSNFIAGENELTVVVHNSEIGTTGFALQGTLEVKNGLCPDQIGDDGILIQLIKCPKVCYSLKTREFWWNYLLAVHVDMKKRLDTGCNGALVGDTGWKRRAEQFLIYLSGDIPLGTSIEYRVFTRSILFMQSGWTAYRSDGLLCGTENADAAITAVQIRLVNAPVNCQLRYRVWTRYKLDPPGPVYTGPGSTVSQYFYNDQIAGSTTAIGNRYPPIIAIEVEIV